MMAPYRVLVIDDEKTFPFGDDVEVTYARSKGPALNLLCAQPWDEVWLDHDLGGEDDIRSIVMTMAESAHVGAPLPISRIVICSLNPVGAKWIFDTIRRYWDIPIEWCTDPQEVHAHARIAPGGIIQWLRVP